MRRKRDDGEWRRPPNLQEQVAGLPLLDGPPKAVTAEAVTEWAGELSHLRAALVALYRRRVLGEQPHLHYVTADDAHAILTGPTWKHRTPPNAVLSHVFRARGWQWTGRLVKSVRPTNHGSDLRCWVYHEQETG